MLIWRYGPVLLASLWQVTESFLLAATLDDSCQGDGAVATPLVAKGADAEAALGVDHADDVAPTGKSGGLGAHRLRTQSRHISAAAFLRRFYGDLHVLGVAERYDHPVPASSPRAF